MLRKLRLRQINGFHIKKRVAADSLFLESSVKHLMGAASVTYLILLLIASTS